MRSATDDPGDARPARPVRAALGLLLGPAVGLGLARFAYALVLPEMRTDLHWSFATAGTMNTANALGYLLGALLAAPLARRFGERRSYVGGLVITAVALLLSAVTGATAVVFLLRLCCGITGAVSFVIGGGLAAQLGRDSGPARATLLLGIYFAGGGAGIALSGLIVPATLEIGGWHLAWVAMGVLAVLACVPAALSARRVPETVARPGRSDAPSVRTLAPLLVAYGLFGAGYIAYMTFVIALLEAGGGTATAVTIFWTALGIAAVAAGFGWSRILAALNPGTGLALVLAILTVGAAVPVLWSTVPAFFFSAILFGATFLTVVTAVTGAARRELPAHQWTSAIARLTVVFALGQCLGPLLAGLVADGDGGLRLGLLIGAGSLAVAALVSLGLGVSQRTRTTG